MNNPEAGGTTAVFEVRAPAELELVFPCMDPADREMFETQIREMTAFRLGLSSVTHAVLDLRGPYPVLSFHYTQGEPEEYAFHPSRAKP